MIYLPFCLGQFHLLCANLVHRKWRVVEFIFWGSFCVLCIIYSHVDSIMMKLDETFLLLKLKKSDTYKFELCMYLIHHYFKFKWNISILGYTKLLAGYVYPNNIAVFHLILLHSFSMILLIRTEAAKDLSLKYKTTQSLFVCM